MNNLATLDYIIDKHDNFDIDVNKVDEHTTLVVKIENLLLVDDAKECMKYADAMFSISTMDP